MVNNSVRISSAILWTWQGTVEEMNVQSAVDQAGRLIEGVQRQARDLLVRNSDTEEPTAGERLGKGIPTAWKRP